MLFQGTAIVEHMGFPVEFPLRFTLQLAEDADENLLGEAGRCLSAFIVDNYLDNLERVAIVQDGWNTDEE